MLSARSSFVYELAELVYLMGHRLDTLAGIVEGMRMPPA